MAHELAKLLDDAELLEVATCATKIKDIADNPVEVRNLLVKLTGYLPWLETLAANRDNAYLLAFQQAYLAAKSETEKVSDTKAEAVARVETHTLRLARDQARGILSAVRETINTLKKLMGADTEYERTI